MEIGRSSGEAHLEEERRLHDSDYNTHELLIPSFSPSLPLASCPPFQPPSISSPPLLAPSFPAPAGMHPCHLHQCPP